MVQDVTKKIEGIQNQKNPEEVHRVPGGPKFSQKIQRQKDRTAMFFCSKDVDIFRKRFKTLVCLSVFFCLVWL